jgi:hypothetical protein
MDICNNRAYPINSNVIYDYKNKEEKLNYLKIENENNINFLCINYF